MSIIYKITLHSEFKEGINIVIKTLFNGTAIKHYLTWPTASSNPLDFIILSFNNNQLTKS